MKEHKADINITEKQSMVEHKTDMNGTKYKKLNMTEYKTDMSMTEKLSSTFTKEHQTEHNYALVNQTTNIRECL